MLNGLPEFTDAAGLDFAKIAQTVGLGDVDFRDDYQFVGLDAFAKFLDVAAVLAGDETFGLRFGVGRSSGATGPMTFALTNAPDVRTALLCLVKFMPIRLDVAHAELVVDSERVHIDWGFTPLLFRRWQFCDFVAATLVRRLLLLTEHSWRPLTVRLTRPPPRNAETHRRILGRSLKFSQPTNSIVLPSGILSIANMNANPAIFDMSRRLLERTLKERNVVSDLIASVREEIVLALPSDSGARLQRVARRLGLSTRSLQRYLANNNITFQELVDDTRKDLALRYLEDPTMTFSQISYRLGFSAPSAFTRASYRWFQRKPSAVRRHLRGGLPAGGVSLAANNY